jgi:hypothetical protein
VKPEDSPYALAQILRAVIGPSVAREFERLRADRDRFGEALEMIRDFDAYQGMPIAPVENPTTKAMRRIAKEALDD